MSVIYFSKFYCNSHTKEKTEGIDQRYYRYQDDNKHHESDLTMINVTINEIISFKSLLDAPISCTECFWILFS